MKTPEEYAKLLWDAQVRVGPGTSMKEKFDAVTPKLITQIIQDVKRECINIALGDCPVSEDTLGALKNKAYDKQNPVPFYQSDVKQLLMIIEWAFMRIDLLIKDQGHDDFINTAYERGKQDGYNAGLEEGQNNRMASLKTMSQIGAISPNQIREEFGLPPIQTQEITDISGISLGHVYTGPGDPNVPIESTPTPDYACDVCHNIPDEYGWLEHGKGCYTQSEDGGGSEYILEADLYRDEVEDFYNLEGE